MATMADVQREQRSHLLSIKRGRPIPEAREKCWLRLTQAIEKEANKNTKIKYVSAGLALSTPLGPEAEKLLKELQTIPLQNL